MTKFTAEDALRSRWSPEAQPRAVRWFGGLGIFVILAAAGLWLAGGQLAGLGQILAWIGAGALAATGGMCLLAAVVIQFPRVVGRLLLTFALPLFLAGLVGIVAVAWAPALLWPQKPLLVHDILAAVGVLGFVSLFAMFAIWWERKVAARMQSRLGPMRVGGWHGWSQSLADGMKLFQKEDIYLADADRVLYRMAPYVAFIPALALFITLPFSAAWVCRDLDVGLIFIFAMFGLGVLGVLLAGWASNNKWSMYGAMREACQMISYEIPLGFSLLVPIMLVGTLRLTTIGETQSGGFHTWLAFANPFTFAAAVMFFVATLASCKRAPFDLPEAESELVAGYHTEYSGFRWCLFFFAEYAEMFAAGALVAILFLGAWHSPLPAAWGAAWAQGPLWQRALHGLLFSGPLWLIAKGIFIVYVQMWLRWTLPRIRLDQVMYACVQVMLPLSMLILLGHTFWQLLVRDGSWLALLANWILTAIGAVGVIGFCVIMIYGLRHRRELVGTLVVDHLPGA